MRFAGCCNISQAHRRSEHSDDLGASPRSEPPNIGIAATLRRIFSAPGAAPQKTQEKRRDQGPRRPRSRPPRAARGRLTYEGVCERRHAGEQTKPTPPSPRPGKLPLTFTSAQEQSRADVVSYRRRPRARKYFVEVHGGALTGRSASRTASRGAATRASCAVGRGRRRGSRACASRSPCRTGRGGRRWARPRTWPPTLIAVTGATKSGKAPSTVRLRVCDRVADKKELARSGPRADDRRTSSSHLVIDDGEDVSAKNPRKALAAGVFRSRPSNPPPIPPPPQCVRSGRLE